MPFSLMFKKHHSLVCPRLQRRQLTEYDLVDLQRQLLRNELLLAVNQPLARLDSQLFQQVVFLQLHSRPSFCCMASVLRSRQRLKILSKCSLCDGAAAVAECSELYAR